jgi:hypothetical protein
MTTFAFQRVNPLGDGFIRGPARVMVEPVTSPFPAKLGEIINLAASGYTTEVQTVATTGTPTGGTLVLAFYSQQTEPIKWNATAAEVQAALEKVAPIGPKGVTCSGGPLPTGVVVTFASNNAEKAQPLLTASGSGLTGGTNPAVTVTRTTAGFGLYDPVGSWLDLGSTRGGVNIARNHTEANIQVDQILAALATAPEEWEFTVTTSFAETTLENLQLAWEGGSIETDVTQTPNERHLPMGNPLSLQQKRLAVIHQKTLGSSAGKIRAHVFRIVQRSPQNSQVDFMKTGEQSVLPHVFRAFADPYVASQNARFGEVIDQQPF